jgi:hypothetical protein
MTGKDLVTKERTSMELQHGIDTTGYIIASLGVCPLNYPQSSLLTLFIASTRTLLVWNLPS